MSTKIFVNLPVKDLAKSIEFFTAMGYRFDEKFTDDKAGCLVIADDILVMLLTEPFFRSFTGKSIADTTRSTEAIIALSQDSRADVDRLADAAYAAGARPAKETEGSPMYTRSFYDLDGHHWEIFLMDPAALQ
ncbi:VOC family protein [Streptomyces sp.]|uniref:VOC family protein n=1 Tax=Streptomyces sp. TaxID=1931 RepID=UPI002F3E3A85